MNIFAEQLAQAVTHPHMMEGGVEGVVGVDLGHQGGRALAAALTSLCAPVILAAAAGR